MGKELDFLSPASAHRHPRFKHHEEQGTLQTLMQWNWYQDSEDYPAKVPPKILPPEVIREAQQKHLSQPY
ncbi:hypothetical protein WG66_008910 [Moniliophthora roreri]|nr:hypothetical protein WG66_008910 [Moniliophthora roreri]